MTVFYSEIFYPLEEITFFLKIEIRAIHIFQYLCNILIKFCFLSLYFWNRV